MENSSCSNHNNDNDNDNDNNNNNDYDDNDDDDDDDPNGKIVFHCAKFTVAHRCYGKIMLDMLARPK